MILLADDQPIALAGLRAHLAPSGLRLDICSSPEETLEYVESRLPRLVISGLFLSVAGRAAIDLIRVLHRRAPDLPLLVRAPSDDPHLRVGLRALGASGLIATSASPDTLHGAIRAVLDGGTWFTPTPPDTPLLLPRDLEILQQIHRATGHKGAAHTVGTSRTAVDKRLAKLRQRFGVGSTAALVGLMLERGFAHLPPESLDVEGNGGTEERRNGGTEPKLSSLAEPRKWRTDGQASRRGTLTRRTALSLERGPPGLR